MSFEVILLSPLPLFLVNKTLAIDFRKYFSQYAPALLGTMAMVVTILITKIALRELTYDFFYLVISGITGTLAYGLTVTWVAPELPKKDQDRHSGSGKSLTHQSVITVYSMAILLGITILFRPQGPQEVKLPALTSHGCKVFAQRA